MSDVLQFYFTRLGHTRAFDARVTQSGNIDDESDRKYEGYSEHATLTADDGQQVPLAALPPVLRALLMTDGTVTKVLEAYFWEPVLVQAQRLQTVMAEQSLPCMQVNKGDALLTRQVILRGERTQRIYATALSAVRLSALPEPVQAALVAGQIGIGTLIRDSGMESFREILDMGAECQPQAEAAILPSDRLTAVHRTYRIISEGLPKILITEQFPMAAYRSLPCIE